MLNSLIVTKAESSLTFKKILSERLLASIKKLMIKYDEPLKTIVVLVKVRRITLGYCHILLVPQKDFNQDDRLDFYIGIPTGLEDGWDEEKITEITRVMMTAGKPRIHETIKL